MSGNDWWNRNVFSCCRKEETDGADCTSSGRVFQKIEAATGNERRPTVDRRYVGTSSCDVNNDRRRRRPGRLDTGTSWFTGAVLISVSDRPWAGSELAPSVMADKPRLFHYLPLYLAGFYTGTNLYCLLTESHVCEQLAPGRCLLAAWPGLQPATHRLQVRRPNHSTIKPLLPLLQKILQQILKLITFLRGYRLRYFSIHQSPHNNGLLQSRLDFDSFTGFWYYTRCSRQPQIL